MSTIGLLIALWRWIALSIDSRKVAAQLKSDTASSDNPLGRVLAAYEANRNADTETIELKLSEAALKEMPGLTKGLLFIKVVSVVAPLMGLLGTVTGMIQVFEVMAIQGTSNARSMAAGVSQAAHAALLDAGLIDRYYWIQSPLWLGDDAVPAIARLLSQPLEAADRWRVVERRHQLPLRHVAGS